MEQRQSASVTLEGKTPIAQLWHGDEIDSETAAMEEIMKNDKMRNTCLNKSSNINISCLLFNNSTVYICCVEFNRINREDIVESRWILKQMNVGSCVQSTQNGHPSLTPHLF